jgi:formylglycine-generating enzyme required for sulfatase activity
MNKTRTDVSHVLHGGSWVSDARYCRSVYRNYFALGDQFSYLGFRLVRVT